MQQRKQAQAVKRKIEAKENCGPRVLPAMVTPVNVRMYSQDGTPGNVGIGYCRFQ